MERLLDDCVNEKIELQIERDGKSFTEELRVQDLHSITPDKFLEVGGAVIHGLSYQQATNFNFQCGAVYVAGQGYMLSKAGVPRHAIIVRFNGEDITTLDDFISVYSKLSRGARVQLEYINCKERHSRQFAIVTVDRHEWYPPPQTYTRSDDSGLWTVTPCSALSSQIVPIVQAQATYSASRSARAIYSVSSNASLAERVKPTLVMLEVHVPPSCILDGVQSYHFVGTGVIIYHSHSVGLVAVDRNTVVVSACDVMLSFAGYPVEIPGEVVFLHPVHNFALVAYDPSSLGTAGSVVHAAKLLPEPALCQGDCVCLVGLDRSLQAISRKALVANPSAAIDIAPVDPPRYRATNMDVIELDTDFGDKFTGVLTDEVGRVRAIWGSFSVQVKRSHSSSRDDQFNRGIPIYTITRILDKITSQWDGPTLINEIRRLMPVIRILEVELYPILLSIARVYGLSDEWIEELVKKDPIRRQVLMVKCCPVGSKARGVLEPGDMILAIDNKPISCFRDIEDACQELGDHENNNGMLNLIIFREGQRMDVVVKIDTRHGNGTTRMINWCGCIVQDPHTAVRALGFVPEEGNGVYVGRCCPGSPVDRYGLGPHQWIVKVNKRPTPDLDAFINVIKEIGHEECVRVRLIDLDGRPSLLALNQDLHYWPTWELSFDTKLAYWRRTTIRAV